MVNSAKLISSHLSETELTPATMLCGALLAAQEDRIWGGQIADLLNADLRSRIQTMHEWFHLDWSHPLAPAPDKKPLSEGLRMIIGRNRENDTRSLMNDLAVHVFGDYWMESAKT